MAEEIKQEQYGIFTVCTGNSEEWNKANPILELGEIGFDSSSNKIKIGNGADTWNSLAYVNSKFDFENLTAAVIRLNNSIDGLDPDTETIQDALEQLTSFILLMNNTKVLKSEDLKDITTLKEFFDYFYSKKDDKDKNYMFLYSNVINQSLNNVVKAIGGVYRKLTLESNATVVFRITIPSNVKESFNINIESFNEGKLPIIYQDITGMPGGDIFTTDWYEIGGKKEVEFGSIENNTPTEDLSNNGVFFKMTQSDMFKIKSLDKGKLILEPIDKTLKITSTDGAVKITSDLPYDIINCKGKIIIE